MITWILLGAVFLAGVGLYGYVIAKDHAEQEEMEKALNHQVDTLLGSIHGVTDTLRHKFSHSASASASASHCACNKNDKFEEQLREASRDN